MQVLIPSAATAQAIENSSHLVVASALTTTGVLSRQTIGTTACKFSSELRPSLAHSLPPPPLPECPCPPPPPPNNKKLQNDTRAQIAIAHRQQLRAMQLGGGSDDVDDDDDDHDDDDYDYDGDDDDDDGGGGDDHHHDDNDDDEDDDNNDDGGGGHTLTDVKGPQSHFSVERGCPHNNASKVALYSCGQ